MSAIADVRAIQTVLGVASDGIAGPKTEAAWQKLKEAALRERQGGASASGIKVAIDAGHGQDSRTAGVYDPGCVHGTLEEADIVLAWAEALVMELNALGIQTFQTRPEKTSSAPVGTRDDRAKANGCTHFISIHVNDADSSQAHGTETLFRVDPVFAERIHAAAMDGLKLTDRGVKLRTDLAVLQFPRSCLLELGFIKNAQDMARVTDPAVMRETCRLIAAAVRG